MTSCRILTPASFDALPDAWRAFLEQHPATRFDQTLSWFQAFDRRIRREGDELALVCCEVDGKPAAMLPMLSRKATGGRRLDALSNYYSAHFEPIVSPGLAPEMLGRELAQTIAAHREWSIIDVNPINPEAPWLLAFEEELRRSGLYRQRYFRFANWFLDVGGRSFDAYFATRPTRLRDTVRRKSAKLAKLDNVEILVPVAAGDMARALDDYDVVYRRSWKKPEPYFEFIREVVEAAGTRNEVRLGLIRVANRPVAAQIWFVRHGVASIFKLAHDSDFARYSVGSILTMHLMRHIIDVDGVSKVDYLSGDEPYKQNWMSDRRERGGLRAFRLTSPGGALGAAWSAAGRLARLFRAPGSGDPQ